MVRGYNGKILRVDLTTGEVFIEKPSDTFYRSHLGGRTLGLHYILNEIESHVESFDEDNLLVFAASVVTGAPIPGLSRHSVLSKSPLTGGFAESEAGGYFGVELKKAGYDAIVIKGKASAPIYLYIKDGKVEIKPANHLWGLDTGVTQSKIRQEIGESSAQLAIIGPAGENLVRYAAIVNDLNHVNGRAGLGAVMGSKNLKAVVVNGSSTPDFADKEAIKRIASHFSKTFKQNADNNQLNQYGTSQYLINANESGTLPTRNFQDGSFEGVEKVSHIKMHEQLTIGSEGCYACPIRCKQLCKFDGDITIDPQYGGPEYEAMTAYSSLCGNDDLMVMVKANELSNRYGLDSISTGSCIAFAMECFERGLITKEETEGIELKFGNSKAIITMVEKIAKREGFGDFLAEGVKRMSEKIGQGCQSFAMHVKGQEFAMHEPRVKYGLGLAYGVSPTGADHLQHEHDGAFDPNLIGYTHESDSPSVFMEMMQPLGIYEPVETMSLSKKKVKLFTYLQIYWSLFNTLGLCIFNFAPVRTFAVNYIPEIVKAVTGWDVSLWELMKVGEKGITMSRLFNLKHGLSYRDDILPDRVYEPLGVGPMSNSKMNREEYNKALKLYYEMMGWDGKTGVPTEGRVAELGI